MDSSELSDAYDILQPHLDDQVTTTIDIHMVLLQY